MALREFTHPQLGLTTYFYRERSLPIRIKFSKNYEFSFELGLLPVPNEIFDSLPRSMIRVVSRPSGEAFSYSSDRLRAGQITWVNIGSRFPLNVSIHVQQEGASPLSQWWPGEISGVRSDAAGVLFDGLTNKLLPADADVVTEHPYWLLTDEWVSRNSFGTQLSVEPIASGLGTGSRFELFRVTAGGYDETAAKFFLRFRARLTEKPARLVPLWPPTVRAPHLLCYDADRLFIAKKGNARIEVYPPLEVSKSKVEELTLLSFRPRGRTTQTVSVGRASILRFVYLWRQKTYPEASAPSVSLTDKNSAPIEGSECGLPPGNEVTATAAWAGRATLRRGGAVIDELDLPPDEPVRIQDIRSGTSLEIFVGSDLIRKVSFQTHKTVSSDVAPRLPWRPNRNDELIPISHSFAAVLSKHRFPEETKAQVYKAVRRGLIPKSLLVRIRAEIQGH